MKITYQYIIGLIAALTCLGGLHAESTSSHQSSSQSSSVSKSVSITSDGERTIKKTVIIRDGVKEVITEVMDKDGNVISTDKEDHQDGKQQNPEDREGGPWLGVRVKELSQSIRAQLNLKEDEGVEVDLVAKDSPAIASDIRVGDILLSLAGNSIASAKELSDEISRHQVGETVKLSYMRAGKRAEVDVTFQGRPKEKQKGDGQKNQGQDRDFDAILNDPNVPESFKKKVREMKEKMKEFRDKHGVNHINVNINGGDVDAILNNPNVPESFKKTIREMLKKVRDTEKGK